MLVVRDRSGPAVYVLLVGVDGRAVNREILDKVAETVEVTGNLIRTGDVWVLYASPASYRRVS